MTSLMTPYVVTYRLFLNLFGLSIYQNDGLGEYISEKHVLRHDVTDDVIFEDLFFDWFGQTVHQNHGIEMNFPKK